MPYVTEGAQDYSAFGEESNMEKPHIITGNQPQLQAQDTSAGLRIAGSCRFLGLPNNVLQLRQSSEA